MQHPQTALLALLGGKVRRCATLCICCCEADTQLMQQPQTPLVAGGRVCRRPAARARRRQGLARQRPQGLGIATRSRREPGVITKITP